jgi:single-strand DNA-binding protein
MNEAQISVCGYVAKQPVTKHMTGDKVKTELRVAWTPRWVNKATGEWVDGITSYATVYCWRKLAVYAGISLRKGEPIVVQGRLTVRPYEIDGVRRESVEIEATSIGHDLGHGVATFSRVKPSTGMSAAEYEAAHGTAPAGQPDGQPDGQAHGQPDGQADGDGEDRSGAADQPLIDEAAIARMEEQELAGDDEYPVQPEPGDEGGADAASGEKRAIGRARKERAALPA